MPETIVSKLPELVIFDGPLLKYGRDSWKYLAEGSWAAVIWHLIATCFCAIPRMADIFDLINNFWLCAAVVSGCQPVKSGCSPYS